MANLPSPKNPDGGPKILAMGAAVALSILSNGAMAAGLGELKIARSGSQPSAKGPATNFIGSVRVDPVFQAQPDVTRAGGSYVTFEPGARTAWHTHPRGQTLVVTSGVGRVQRWGDSPQEIKAGDVVWIPPNQKHWHGGAPTTGMTHLAISEHENGKTVDWMEMVTDDLYLAAPAKN